VQKVKSPIQKAKSPVLAAKIQKKKAVVPSSSEE
jgi:hypothetical protein